MRIRDFRRYLKKSDSKHERLAYSGICLLPCHFVSYGQLKLHPSWGPMRGDPRFETLAEESKKPVALE